jgi:Xaa-Pro aminopeptidase
MQSGFKTIIDFASKEFDLQLIANRSLMNYQQKLNGIRTQMRQAGIDAYIIPASDPHMSEYVPERFKCIQFVSGFSGSAGTLVITQEFAGLWADFRYFEQAQLQLENSGYELVKLTVQHTPEYIGWLLKKLNPGSVVGFDYQLMSMALAEELRIVLAGKQIDLQNEDLLQAIWDERPELPREKIYLLEEAQCGQRFRSKLSDVRDEIAKAGADLHLISSLDDLAWLFNIRGSDVSYNPVVLCYSIIDKAQVTLFIDREKLTSAHISLLQARSVTIKGYDELGTSLKQLQKGSTILLDAKRTSYGCLHLIPDDLFVILQTNPVVFLKAIKNKVEIDNMRLAMISDGVALTRFFKWLEENIDSTYITESSAALKVIEFRELAENFAGPSFASIAGYAANAALPHYTPSKESDKELKPKGLFLLDSGGHYFFGTTDVTRTVPLGDTTLQEKEDYTMVLSALIFGSDVKFPVGTKGYQLDGICRQQLWQKGINYGHGTGHGVGYYLNVHEGPQNIGPANVAVSVAEGMITSIEPGIYRPGEHGVRLENLVLTTAGATTAFGEFLKFDTITLAHIDTSMILDGLLLPEQIRWLNAYHQLVLEKLKPHLTEEEATWLAEKCRPIG